MRYKRLLCNLYCLVNNKDFYLIFVSETPPPPPLLEFRVLYNLLYFCRNLLRASTFTAWTWTWSEGLCAGPFPMLTPGGKFTPAGVMVGPFPMIGNSDDILVFGSTIVFSTLGSTGAAGLGGSGKDTACSGSLPPLGRSGKASSSLPSLGRSGISAENSCSNSWYYFFRNPWN